MQQRTAAFGLLLLIVALLVGLVLLVLAVGVGRHLRRPRTPPPRHGKGQSHRDDAEDQDEQVDFPRRPGQDD